MNYELTTIKSCGMYINAKVETTMSKKTENDGNETLTIAKVDNGYVINFNKTWYEGEGDKRKYHDDTRTVISDSNPLSKEGDETATVLDDMSTSIKSLFEDVAASSGKIIVD